jgi:hypothetical protein
MQKEKIISGVLAVFLCAGTAITRADDIPQQTLQWNFTDGSKAAFNFTKWSKITFDAAGNALFTLSDGNTKTYSLANVESITFPVQTLTAIPKLTARAANVRAYPNPVVDELTVESENALGAVTLTDLSGRTVKSLESREKQIFLNLNNLPKGVYILKAAGKASKIIKN